VPQCERHDAVGREAVDGGDVGHGGSDPGITPWGRRPPASTEPAAAATPLASPPQPAPGQRFITRV